MSNKSRNYSESLDTVVFRCHSCKKNFECKPERVEDEPARAHHPFRYFAACPVCGEEVEQAQYHVNLIKAWCNSTGPKTEEGKAATAKNLEGHPTPEEAKRTRFNAMKHGLNARVAQYFPAKPDKYAACETCDIDRAFCASQPACQKQTQLFMLHQAAFEQRDPKHLIPIYADMQAGITAIMQQILQTILKDGVSLRTPAWAVDKDGKVVIAEYVDLATGQLHRIHEVKAHPLLRVLQDFLSKNGMSLADMGMTPRVIEQEEAAMGKLAQDGETQQSLLEYSQRQAAALENLADLAKRANAKKMQDPVLIEYQQQNGGNNEQQR